MLGQVIFMLVVSRILKTSLQIDEKTLVADYFIWTNLELLYLTRMEMYDSILVIIRRRICCMLSIVRNEDNVN